MRIGCFAFALALVASAFTAEAWSPPYQTQRLHYSNASSLRSNSSMSLDGVGAFTIRFTGLKFDWTSRDYGMVLHMKAEDVRDDLMIGFTGNVSGAPNGNELVASFSAASDAQYAEYGDTTAASDAEYAEYGNTTAPSDAEYAEYADAKGFAAVVALNGTGGKELDVVVALNGTSGRLAFYVDGSFHAASEPLVPSPFYLPDYVSGHFSVQGGGQDAQHELDGHHEALTIWAGVALDPAVVREVHEGFYANVPTPNHHYSFCEGGSFVAEPGNVSDPLTDVAIADHITGDPAHALRWSGRFEMFREAPAEGAAFVGAMSECCEAKSREFGVLTRVSNGTFRATVDSLVAESVAEGRRCHAAPAFLGHALAQAAAA